MSLPLIALHVVRDLLQKIEQSGPPCRKIMSLGYPDILVPVSAIGDLFGQDIVKRLEFHPDSASIARWHSITHLTDRIVESRHFFSLLGFELEVVDISRARGDEIILDLNLPCPDEMHQRYALVMDGGTIEHCFNIAQAIRNLAAMVVKDGWVYQSNPLNAYNHGFYNLNPTFYFDFYEKNGFAIELFKIVTHPHNPKLFDPPRAGKFQGLPEGSSNLLAAQRKTIVELSYPIQTKYVANPTLKG